VFLLFLVPYRTILTIFKCASDTFIPFFLLFYYSFVRRGEIRNLGKPVALCKQYYDGGADEVVFLNITSFRQGAYGSS
jgi:hypothetical protein